MIVRSRVGAGRPPGRGSHNVLRIYKPLVLYTVNEGRRVLRALARGDVAGGQTTNHKPPPCKSASMM